MPSSTELSKTSPEMLRQIESVLDFIRANLNNIRYTWGTDSAQYKSASEIMRQYFDENLKRIDAALDDSSLDALFQNLSIEESKPA